LSNVVIISCPFIERWKNFALLVLRRVGIAGWAKPNVQNAGGSRIIFLNAGGQKF